MSRFEFAATATPTDFPMWAISQHQGGGDEWVNHRDVRCHNLRASRSTDISVAAVETLPMEMNHSQSIKLLDWPLSLDDEQRSLVVGEILEYPKLQPGWDGSPDDVAPSSAAADQAATFVELLPPFVPVPEPSVAADGEVILYWKDADLYIEVGFRGSESYSYFAQRGAEKIKGPARIEEMFSSADRVATFLIKAFPDDALHV